MKTIRMLAVMWMLALTGLCAFAGDAKKDEPKKSEEVKKEAKVEYKSLEELLDDSGMEYATVRRKGAPTYYTVTFGSSPAITLQEFPTGHNFSDGSPIRTVVIVRPLYRFATPQKYPLLLINKIAAINDNSIIGVIVFGAGGMNLKLTLIHRGLTAESLAHNVRYCEGNAVAYAKDIDEVLKALAAESEEPKKEEPKK